MRDERQKQGAGAAAMIGYAAAAGLLALGTTTTCE